MKFNKQTIYIGLFAILYLIVAFSSFWHACAFFGLANNSWMSIILAFAFEVGQAAVLFSLLTSKKDRSRIMPWVLMSMFTLVQVIGNVYSSYKYIITNSVENLRYFKEPIFIWTTLPDDQATVIIVYIVGAILPVCALLLTSMITKYLTDKEEEKKELENKQEVTEEEFDEFNKDVEKINSKEVEELNNSLKEKDKIIDEINNQLKDRLNNLNESDTIIKQKDEEIEELKKQVKNYEENPLINEHSILQIENQGLIESNQKKDKEIENLKKQLEELEKIKENDNKENEKTLLNDRSNDSLQQKEEYNDKKEENSQQGMSTTNVGLSTTETIKESDSKGDRGESDKKEETKLDQKVPEEYKEQVEDLIKNGIKENKIEKESHFIN